MDKAHDSLMSINPGTGFGTKLNTTTSSMAGENYYFGGNKFHSSKAVWDPHNSLIRDQSIMHTSNLRIDTADHASNHMDS